MSPADNTPPDRLLNSLDQLHHDLKSPLTAIHGRAQLLARAIRRSPSLTDAERAGMLEGLVAIEAAVLVLVATIDAMGHEGTGKEGSTDPD